MTAPAAFERRLRAYAEVIVRVGLNLRPGQSLSIAEPFELQGVAREAAALVDAVTGAARAAGAREVDVIWGDEARLRAAALSWPDREFEAQVAQNTARMLDRVQRGDALLFLQGSQPSLMAGIAARQVAALRERCWMYYGTVAQELVAGRTNWTVAPAPARAWAEVAFPAAPAGERLSALWEVVFQSCRVDAADPLVAWREHLSRLDELREKLTRERATRVRFHGPGTDLSAALSPDHVWCTARLETPDGRPFVANLPTEEVFTAPDCRSAEGTVAVARPIAYGGDVIDGIALEFRNGRVVRAEARTGEALLREVLTTDRGASRLGEVALVGETAMARAGACFFHPLLDENALPHLALGDGYPFCVGAQGARRLNHSLVHIDLPVAAGVEVE